MHLEDAIQIDCPVKDLYNVISDVEGHAALLPGYVESRIVDRQDDHVVLQREAIIHGKRRRWKSEVRFELNQALHFRQLEGPFEGMQVLWGIKPRGSSTELRIIHDVSIKPWWKKWWVELVIAKPAIERTARLVLESIKLAAEARIPL